jgi:catechol 2,3-dioxygenase-like lactoylglutathione lyase family enzyme
MNSSISAHSVLSAIVATITVLFARTQLQAQSSADKPAPSASWATDSSPTIRLKSFTIIVRDYDEAKDWYVGKLGFVTLIDQKFGPSQRFVLVAPPGSGKEDVGFVLEKARRDDPTMPTDYTDRVGKEVNIVLRTNDLSRLCATYRDRGIHFRQAPKQQPWGGEATVEDLYGNSIVLVGPITEVGSEK